MPIIEDASSKFNNSDGFEDVSPGPIPYDGDKARHPALETIDTQKLA